MNQRTIAAASVIAAICTDLNYSRAHVASMLRKHQHLLRARRERKRWVLPQESILALHNIVLGHSGPRYKLGERRD